MAKGTRSEERAIDADPGGGSPRKHAAPVGVPGLLQIVIDL
jgi:hypothetical protein